MKINKTKKAVSMILSAVMLMTNINVTRVSAAQTLYGDYVLISNTSHDYQTAQSTGNIVFDETVC